MITGLHTTYSQGFYKAERNLGLKVSEDIGLVTGTDLRAQSAEAWFEIR